MASLYFDENVATAAAQFLRSLGYDAVTTRDQETVNTPDYDLLLSAAREGRIFVSHNANDLQLLHGAWLRWSQEWQVQAEHSGILIIEQRLQLNARSIGSVIDQFIQQQPTFPNTLYRLTPHGWR